MFNTRYYKRLSPAYSVELHAIQKPSHHHEEMLIALPVTSCMPLSLCHHHTALEEAVKSNSLS